MSSTPLCAAAQGYSSGGTMSLKVGQTRLFCFAFCNGCGAEPGLNLLHLAVAPSMICVPPTPPHRSPRHPHVRPFAQLPRYIMDEGKDLRIDGIIPTDAAPRGGFNAEGSPGKLKKGLDYPPVIYVAMQVGCCGPACCAVLCCAAAVLRLCCGVLPLCCGACCCPVLQCSGVQLASAVGCNPQAEPSPTHPTSFLRRRAARGSGPPVRLNCCATTTCPPT